MFKLFKATTIVSITTITSIFVGIIRAKFTAVNLGPAGIGIFSQALNFQQLAITISSLSIGLGVTKYISKYNAQGEISKVGGVVSSAVCMQVTASFISMLFVFGLSAPLSLFLFSKGDYRLYLPILSLSIPFLVLAGTGEAVLFGFGNYKAFATARSLSILLSLAPLFVFIYLMKIKGGFFYLAANGLLTFLIYCCLVYKNIPRDLINKIFNIHIILYIKDNLKEFGKPLLLYGGASFVTGILSLVNIVFLRSLVIRYFGIEANGYYQVVFGLSTCYLTFFTNGLWSYFYPKISSLNDMKEYSVEVNHAIRFCIFGIVPFMTGLFLFKDLIINLIYSNKFIYSRELFATQLFGDLLFILLYIMGTSLLASARLKGYLVFGLLYSLSFIGLFILLRNTLGLKAVTISYLISNLTLFLIIFFYHMKTMNLKIYKRNIMLFCSSIVVSVIILFFGKNNGISFMVKIGLLILWLFLLSTNSEKKKLFCFIRNKLKAKYGYAT